MASSELRPTPALRSYRLRTPPPAALTRRGAQVSRVVAARLGPRLAQRAVGRRLTAVEIARPLRRACEDLGATFVKYGQVIASSPSLFGEEAAAEFRSCLDTGPAVPIGRLRPVIERGLGRPVEEVFCSLDPSPVGQASLAVVHRGVLQDGSAVAVKVLRPHIEAKIAADLSLMTGLFRGLGATLVPGLRDVLLELLDGLRRQLEEELDLRNEAAMMAYFRALPLDGAPLVVVPEPHAHISGRRVLVMEYLDGVAIDDALAAGELGHEAGPLIEQVVKAWFSTALRNGIFHGDVHAGNILLTRDGRAGMIDWGIVGRLSPESHWLLRRFIAAALGDEGAWDELADHLAEQLASLNRDGVAVDRHVLRVMLRSHVGAIVTRPFGEISLAETLAALQGRADELLGSAAAGPRQTAGRLGRLRQLSPNVAVMDRGMMLLAKQLAYFERYGRLYLGDVSLLRDEAFFREALAAGPLGTALGEHPA